MIKSNVTNIYWQLNMANERNTETLVRNDLKSKGYYDDPNVIVEEQKSASSKVGKLLLHASKSGEGAGRPEFIIRFKDKPENIIVIECKASPLKHESKNRQHYKDYAVDGVLLYAEYLKKEFNVTAIAVSGEYEREKRVSTFLWLKNAYVYSNVQDKVFLTPSEVIKITSEQSSPVTEEYLIKKAMEYNDALHKYSIPEVERCTFISSILVALQDDMFLMSYALSSDNSDLLDSLYEACKRVLRRNKLSNDKIDVILAEYKKFQYNKMLTSSTVKIRGGEEKHNQILLEMIDDIKSVILPTIRGNHFDILGKFYTQFIRYAGADAKTGLVLTPNHITDFFCDIADLRQNDVVFDPCCGTGGFLVSAMKYMLQKAGNSEEVQKNIKSKQLIGVEQRSDMFSHVCSNMMMRGDGKSHIYFGDCFDIKIKSAVKKENPDVSFLNPPYQDGNAAEQLEFVANALECIKNDGICIAICQMSTVVSTSKAVINIRKKLLENHTLISVFSMPDDLFYPVGVVTCIIVFKAHAPHPENKETFFGYFKYDGFVKRKNKGRLDSNNQWSSIKRQWLDAYINKKNIPGLSVMHKVKAEDEWCAEAYMETDYSTIDDSVFIKAIKDFVAFQFLSKEYK